MAVAEWGVFFRNCLHRRVSPEDVQLLSNTLKQRNPIFSTKLVRILFQCHRSFCVASDPLASNYLAALTLSSLVAVYDILLVITQELGAISERLDAELDSDDYATWSLAGRTLQELITIICDGKAQNFDAPQSRQCLIVLSKGITTIAVATGKLVSSSRNDEKASQAVSSTLESAGNLLCAIVGTEIGMTQIMDSNEKELRVNIIQSVNTLLGLPLQLPMLLRPRLEEIQKHFALFDADTSKATDEALLGNVAPNALQFAASVPFVLPMRSRATLYIYFNAALCGRPMLDDAVLVRFLNARYAEDHMALFVDLALASFDVLANAFKRKENAQAKNMYQSCILNKVPLLLSDIMGSPMLPEDAELCVTQILSRLDPTVFPSSSETVDTAPEKSSLSDMRQDFLLACVLHKLIPNDSVKKLLGEEPVQSHPSRALFSKQELTQDTLSSSRKVEQLIDDVLSMDGNAGIAVQALVEVMHHLCQTKETMTLKGLCSSIVRKPESLDIIFLFRTPAFVLNPLCTLLDEWKWGDDHGESQPVYDEFGSILLLVLTAKYRFDLEANDFGILKIDSFVFRLLYLGPQVKRLEALSESESTHLGSWITALFKDEGLGDELLSSCSPQEFYLLIPTLFSQSLDACEAGKLTYDTMKSGFDYLLEAFLLPSVVIAISWLKRHIWELNGDHGNTFKILLALISPANLSTESRDLHQTIISMMAISMAEQLQNVLKRHPSLAQPKQIMTVLQSRLSFGRKNMVSRPEMSSWTSPNILKTLQSHLGSLLFWITAIEASTSPPAFTFNLVNVAIQLRGAGEVFNTLFSFLCNEVAAGSLDAPLDLILSIICSPSQTLGRHSLREALKIAFNNLPKVLEKQDTITAELLVRLNGLVDAHTHVPLPLPQQTALDAAAAVTLDLDDMDLNMATSNALENAVEGVAAPQEGVVGNIDDMLNAAEGFDMGMSGMGGIGGDSLDDMFGGDGDPGDLDLSAADLELDLDKIF